ncbi:uncharacterized protein FIBRA_04779 [Fibroporia radiculosa]|uniref:Uncharacterized protein n=1 Tax=Fibroporia radiculosa TaxID=599839 RepID=J4H353_9APHY|nr:uncharacterized protein FIBRA_04779 [Fibroporia radiculosa]CCM02674.1 predicted protein [Fibroporia radiculosa]
MPTCAICLNVLKDPAALPCVQATSSATAVSSRWFAALPHMYTTTFAQRADISIPSVDPNLVPHHLQSHVTPAIRKLRLDYSIPSASTTPPTSTELDQLRAEIASLRECCMVWRKRAALHATATMSLVGLARMTRDGAVKMKAQKDELETKYVALKRSFEESQTLATFPPQPERQRESRPAFCPTFCETPQPLSPNSSRAASHRSFRTSSPALSDASYCSECSECCHSRKRKREDTDTRPIKRSHSSMSVLPPSPQLRRAGEERVMGSFVPLPLDTGDIPGCCLRVFYPFSFGYVNPRSAFTLHPQLM